MRIYKSLTLRSAGLWLASSLLASVLLPASAMAVPVIYTSQVDWIAAIVAADPTATFGLEDFNGEPITGGNGLGTGPHTYGSGAFDITLNNIGDGASGPSFGGSQTGIINPGEFDGTNALEVRLVQDSSDFELFPGFNIDGEGTEWIDGLFATSVLGFAAEFNSATTHDGVAIQVNGVTILLHDFYPDDTLQDGDGFLGIIDLAGITSFAILLDDQDINNAFENFEMDDFRWASAGNGGGPGPGPSIPEPGAVLLFTVGMLTIGWRQKRSN